MTYQEYMLRARLAALKDLRAYDRQLAKIYQRLIDETLDILKTARRSYAFEQRHVLASLVEAAGRTTSEASGLMDKAFLDAGKTVSQYTEKGLKNTYLKILDREGIRVDMGKLLYRVPQEAVQTIYTRVYQDGLYLSERIWRLNVNTQRGLQKCVVDGLARGLHYDDPKIAEQVRRFLQPARMGKNVKPTITRTLKDGTKYTFRQRPVSYDAARLLRTEYMNAFRESSSICAQRNPACTGERWVISPFHPDTGCECEDYAEHDEGLGEGVFPVGDLPLNPHPQCLCTTEQVTVEMEEFLGWAQDFMAGERSPISEWWETYGMNLAA